MRRIKKMFALLAVAALVWVVATIMAAAPLVGLGLGWLLVIYVVARALPAIRRDLHTLRLRARLTMQEIQTGELA